MNLVSEIKKLSPFFERLNFFLALAIALAIPFPREPMPFLIFFWLLTWILEGNFKTKLAQNGFSAPHFLLIAFFALHFVTLIYSDNPENGLSLIERRLSFVIFPVVFAATNRLYAQQEKILMSFALGNLLAALLCFSNAFFQIARSFSTRPDWEFSTRVAYYFSYSHFSEFIHQAYFGVFLAFSVVVLFRYRQNAVFGKKARMGLKFLGMVFLLFTIYVVSSKSGIGAGIVVLSGLLYIVLKQNQQWWLKIVVSGLVLGLVFLAFQNQRFSTSFGESRVEKIDKDTRNSSEVRFLAWRAAVEVIGENFWLGTGLGDEVNELMKKYEHYGYTFPLEKRMNAHNQFLATFVEMGLPGILVLLALVFFPLYYGFRRKDYVLVLFLIISVLIMSFENAFSVQKGVVFFAFFYGLLGAGNRE